MKFEQLRYFQEACKYGSISVAAEHNYISQPSFSAAITKLEKELGVTLLNRNSRGVTPTTAGKAILEKIQGIFDLVNDINGIASRILRVALCSLQRSPAFVTESCPWP